MNLPNYLSLSRIFSVPILIWVLTDDSIHDVHGRRELLASAIFVLASITDVLDGYLARRRKQITPMGMLLDPLADKLMVTAAFIALVKFNPSIITVWVAVVVIGREFLVSGLRSIATGEGFTIEASDLGKIKMVVQIVTVVAAILNRRWDWWMLKKAYIGFDLPFDLSLRFTAQLAVWFMVVLSLWSALDYFIAFWRKIEKRVTVRTKRRMFVLSRRRPKSDVPVV